MWDKRALVLVTVLYGLVGICFGQLPAPVAGPSVNMVSGTQLPGGDPFLQRQNEPSMAVSSRNALHLMGGANDYRTVDLPGVPGGEPTGEAWLGLFKSFDGGKNWVSTLLPGYPQDQSALGIAAPMHGFQAAADPIVRAGTNGLFYYSGIAFNRTATGAKGSGIVFVSSFIDDNNREGSDTIRYLGTSTVKASSAANFEDKPSIAVDIPRLGAKTCAVPGSPAQSFAGGKVYIAWTEFTGPKANNDARIQFSKSDDCGKTWSIAQNISGTQHTNQGASLAIDTLTGAVYVVWRVFAFGAQLDAIMLTASYDGGRTWTLPAPVAAISPFDQGTTGLSFRTNAYPALAVDLLRRIYVAWAQRGLPPNGDSRVVLTSIVPPLTDDTRAWRAVQWPVASTVDAYAGRGHQFMPAMAFSSGKLSLAWYDLRFDDQISVYSPLGGGQYQIQLLPDGTAVFGPFIQDPAPPYLPSSRRNTLDVRLAHSPPGFPQAFGPSIQVSQYEFGSPAGFGNTIEQLQVNPPNLPMFQQGTVPFLGDYIDIAGPTFIPLPAPLSFVWRPNVLAFDPDYTRVVWTDNRNVVQPADGDWTHYTPVGVAGPSVFDPTQQRPACAVGQGGSRNQDIFTASVSPLLVTAKSNAKPLSKALQREFPITVENTTGTARFYRLTVQQQPVGGKASFLQFPVAGLPDPLVSVDVQIAANASSARSVFITASDPNAAVPINVVEIQAPNAATVPNGLQGSVLLNADASNPNISNPNISNTEVYTPNISNPNISNPNISNPNISNPNISNPNISNPNISNAVIANPNISNPNISNPNISNPNISNPNISNPNISNPNISNTALTDTTWTVSNTGNTAAAYSLKLLQSQPPPPGVIVQLIVSKTYTTPVVLGCNLAVETHYLPVANITSPVFTDPLTLTQQTANDPFVPSVSLAPAETALITIRSLDQTTSDPVAALQHYNPSQSISPVAVGPATATPNALPSPPTLSLLIATLSLPAATVSGAFSQTLSAAGGTPPYSWSITAGNADGLLIGASTGVLQGVPAAAFPTGTQFAVTLLDHAGNSTTRVFNLIVNPAPAITTTVLSDADRGFLYVPQTLQVTGGTPPATWNLASGALPAGLALSAAGVVSGTPAANAVSSTFTVRATDVNHVAATKPLTINVFAPPAITTVSLPAAEQGVVYNQTILATGGLPETWSITAGTIPSGLAFAAGVLSGTPTAAGTYTFTVQVQDTLGATAIRQFTILVKAPPSITGGALPDATENAAYSFVIPVSNGTAPFVFQLTGGSLPPGLTLSPSGTISGIQIVGCAFPFAVTVTDSLGGTGSAQFSLNVVTPATQQFTGAYVLQNWTATASNGGTPAINPSTGPSGCPAFSYNINLGSPASGVSARTWTFQTTTPADGTVTFNWRYTGFHAFFQVTALLQVFAGANTITLYSAGPTDCCTTPSAGFDVSGTATIPVTAGSPFGVIAGGSNGDSNSQLNGTLTIWNFTAPGQ
jgi:hypothetical protein